MSNSMLMRTLVLAVAALNGGSAMAAYSCTVAVGTLAFGSYTGAQSNSSATLTVRCTRALFVDDRMLPYTATLSTGGGTFAQRRMTKVPDTLNYNLYLTTVPAVLNTNVWGNGTGGTVIATGTVMWSILATSATSTQTVAGAIPGGAYPSAGLYQDTITVTLTYD